MKRFLQRFPDMSPEDMEAEFAKAAPPPKKLRRILSQISAAFRQTGGHALATRRVVFILSETRPNTIVTVYRRPHKFDHAE